MIVCATCGTENTDRAKFCQECATPLVPAGTRTGETRKTVTVLFCDVTGSTSLGERLDPEATRAVMTTYFAAMSRVVESHGGTVEKFIGDAVMAVFGVPVLHEDDALRALRAATGMRDELEHLNSDFERDFGVRLRVRIGVNTGEVVVGADSSRGTVATGDAVNVGARLEQAAGPGEILLGPKTYALVRADVVADAVAGLELRGKSGPVAAWRLREVTAAAETTRAMQLSSRLVGRDREVQLLRQALDRCIADRRPQLVTVLGTAGVGKSRLLSDFLDALDTVDAEAVVLSGHCLAYGEDIVFWPLLEMLQGLAETSPGDDPVAARSRLRRWVAAEEDADRVVESLAPLVGLPGTRGDLEETSWALRRLVESIGRDRSVLLVLDDAHWADGAMLDVIERLADWTRDTALLVLVLARPELVDDRPNWSGGKLNAVTTLLEPLRAKDAADLLANLLGTTSLDGETRSRILDAAGGMPLYVEQMLAMLGDDGVLDHVADMPVVVEVPPSIAALLAARLDRLPVEERTAVEAAAVVGMTFSSEALVELVRAEPEDVGRVLRSLSRKQLVRPAPADLPGEEGFSFSHALIRETAYAGLSKVRRSDLHEAFARWLGVLEDRLHIDVNKLIGHHLEQVVLLRRSLGPVDEATRQVAAEAATRLSETGRSLVGADVTTTASLHNRAAMLLEPSDPRRVRYLRAAGEAWAEGGDYKASMAALTRAAAEARTTGDERQAELAEVVALDVSGHMDVGRDPGASDRFQRSLSAYREAGDAEGMVVTGLALLEVLNEAGLYVASLDLLSELLPMAELEGDTIHIDRLQAMKGAALFLGPSPVQDALVWIDAKRDVGGRSTQIGRAFARAAAMAYLDRRPEAYDALTEGEALVTEASTLAARAWTGEGAGVACRHLDDLAGAERYFRRSVQAWQTLGETAYLSTIAPELGEVRRLQGDQEEARELAELGRSLTASTDLLSQAWWRILAARLDAADGLVEQAVTLADEAVTWLAGTDMSARADVLVGRAEVLVAAERPDDAARDLRDALTLYTGKDDRPCARLVRARLADLPAPLRATHVPR